MVNKITCLQLICEQSITTQNKCRSCYIQTAWNNMQQHETLYNEK